MMQNFIHSKIKLLIVSMVLVAISISVLMWNFCITDGCFFDTQSNVCRSTECIGESIFDHLQERTNLLSALPSSPLLAVLSAIFLIVSLLSVGSIFQTQLDRIPLLNPFIRYFEIEIRDPILDALSNGRLNPKIYFSHS